MTDKRPREVVGGDDVQALETLSQETRHGIRRAFEGLRERDRSNFEIGIDWIECCWRAACRSGRYGDVCVAVYTRFARECGSSHNNNYTCSREPATINQLFSDRRRREVFSNALYGNVIDVVGVWISYVLRFEMMSGRPEVLG